MLFLQDSDLLSVIFTQLEKQEHTKTTCSISQTDFTLICHKLQQFLHPLHQAVGQEVLTFKWIQFKVS